MNIKKTNKYIYIVQINKYIQDDLNHIKETIYDNLNAEILKNHDKLLDVRGDILKREYIKQQYKDDSSKKIVIIVKMN